MSEHSLRQSTRPYEAALHGWTTAAVDWSNTVTVRTVTGYEVAGDHTEPSDADLGYADAGR